jgi:hypothetical protein
MRLSIRDAAIALALLAWGVAAILAWLLVGRIGWLGIALLGGAILLVAVRVELYEDIPNIRANRYLTERLLDASNRETAAGSEGRFRREASLAERNRWLYVMRTIGIALGLLGANMFILHQL